MKRLSFLFFFIIFFGLQIAHAATIGVPEMIILLVVGFVAIGAMIGFVFFCLYLIKRSGPTTKNEK
jgi:hypothetical protein